MTEETLSTYIESAINNIQHNTSESGNNLQEVMTNIRHRPYEVGAMFDCCGQKNCEKTNHSYEAVVVAMPDEWRDLANLMVHNHVIDRTFSTGDLIASKNFDLGISIVVTPSYNFYLFRPTKGWPEGNEWIEEYSILIKKIQQSRRHNCNWATASHLALDELANHYGIIYRVTDLHGNSIPKEELKVS